MEFDWYYLNTGTKKHAVEPAALKAFPIQMAICGRQVFAYLPRAAQWQNDPEGLDSREECIQCSQILNTR